MTIEILADDALVDPCAAALAAARKQVDVKTADGRVCRVLYREIANVFMPAGDFVLGLEANAVQSLGKLKQAVYDFFNREVLAQRLV